MADPCMTLRRKEQGEFLVESAPSASDLKISASDLDHSTFEIKVEATRLCIVASSRSLISCAATPRIASLRTVYACCLKSDIVQHSFFCRKHAVSPAIRTKVLDK